MDETWAWPGVAVLAAALLLLKMEQCATSKCVMRSSYAWMMVLRSWGVLPTMSGVLVIERDTNATTKVSLDW